MKEQKVNFSFFILKSPTIWSMVMCQRLRSSGEWNCGEATRLHRVGISCENSVILVCEKRLSLLNRILLHTSPTPNLITSFTIFNHTALRNRNRHTLTFSSSIISSSFHSLYKYNVENSFTLWILFYLYMEVV